MAWLCSHTISDEEYIKNVRHAVFNLLRILKFFYSFKGMERLLGIRSQTLWKYITLRAILEKDTASKFLARIKERRLIEELMSRITGEGK